MNPTSGAHARIAWSTDLATRGLACAIVFLYRVTLSPLLLGLVGPACRFDPTCSQYADEAISEHGLIMGGWMALRRLSHCRPGGGWGYDPVKRAHSS